MLGFILNRGTKPPLG